MENGSEVVPAGEQGMMAPGDMQAVVSSGGALQRTHTGFITAVQVQKPRVKKDIQKACIEEARLAGKEFYYAWTVKDNRARRSVLVEGPSVNMALAAAREWGNCGVMMDVQETMETYIFTATFVDIETGYNIQRTFRQKKTRKIGKMDEDRAEDIVFQIGQSKAIRNVILNALPSWLIEDMMDASRENIVDRITKKGLDAARKDTLDFFARYDISQDRIEKKIGKKATAWGEKDLALLYGAIQSLSKGMESPQELFPPVRPTFDMSEEKLATLNGLFDQLRYNDADRTMKLGACKGDAQAIAKLEDELRNELEKELTDARIRDKKAAEDRKPEEKAQERTEEKPEEKPGPSAPAPSTPPVEGELPLGGEPSASSSGSPGTRSDLEAAINELEKELKEPVTSKKKFNEMGMQELRNRHAELTEKRGGE